MSSLLSWKKDRAKRVPADIAKLAAFDKVGEFRNEQVWDVVVTLAAAGRQAQAQALAGGTGVKLRLPLEVGPTDTLLSWCKANLSTGYTVLHPSEAVQLVASTPNSLPFEYETESAVLATLHEAAWVPGSDFIIASDGTVLDTGYLALDLLGPGTIHVAGEASIAYHRPAETVRVTEAIFLSAPFKNIGHWFIDFLPRLQALTSFPHSPVVIPETTTAREVECLNYFGVDQSRVIRCRADRTYLFDRLHVFRPGRSMPPNPHNVLFVREALGKHATSPRRGKRIFVGRESVGTRAIRNMEEFSALLASENFITVDPAFISFRDQLELFGDAEIIMGPFGTNLLTLYHAPPGCNIIALMHDPSDDPCVAPTSAILNMRHQFFICEKTDEPGKKRFKKDTDVWVDCASLQRRLKSLMSF